LKQILESLLKKNPKDRASYKDIAKYQEISQNFINIPGLPREILIEERLSRIETRIKNL
jgi:hypothetical protein